MSAVDILKGEIALERAAGEQHDLAAVALRTLCALAADRQIFVIGDSSFQMTPAGRVVAREILETVRA